MSNNMSDENKKTLWRVPVYEGRFDDIYDDEENEFLNPPVGYFEVEAEHAEGSSDSAIGIMYNMFGLDDDSNYTPGEPEESGHTRNTLGDVIDRSIQVQAKLEAESASWENTARELAKQVSDLERAGQEKDKLIAAQAAAISVLKAELRSLGSALVSTAAFTLKLGNE